MVVEIVAAYASNHTMHPMDLPGFIRQAHNNMFNINDKKIYAPTSHSEPTVPIEESIQPNLIVCLKDGKHIKMLKPHLCAIYDMTPALYREHSNLVPWLPLTTPNIVRA
jgi:predicted transcriptional regulator